MLGSNLLRDAVGSSDVNRFHASLFIIQTTAIMVSGHKMVLNVSLRMLWPSFSLYILVLRPQI